ncbi:MAG: hypothetical protein ABIQ73_00750 [Acidimicrobiales bacterium]
MIRELDLLGLSGAAFDDLYRGGTVAAIPRGTGRGTAIFAPGRGLGRVLAKITGRAAWQGKVIDPDGRHLVNLVSPLRLRAIRARVYEGDSWLDGGPSIFIDYSTTSLVARWVHDEIREVAPGTYLGLVYLGRRRLPLRFALDFSGEEKSA